MQQLVEIVGAGVDPPSIFDSNQRKAKHSLSPVRIVADSMQKKYVEHDASPAAASVNGTLNRLKRFCKLPVVTMRRLKIDAFACPIGRKCLCKSC